MTEGDYSFDARLAFAETPPAGWYFEPAMLEREKSTVFARAWQLVGRAVEFSDEIQIEDIRICEAVQRGLRSRTYARGRYSVKRENGVHHFHGLLSEFLARG
jgi:hypothetical protein